MPIWGISARGRSALAWLVFVLPCLMLNYFGQGALMLRDPSAVENPFFLLGPAWLRLPMVILATVATVIASQAVISGAFSMAQPVHATGLPAAHDRAPHLQHRGRPDLRAAGQHGAGGRRACCWCWPSRPRDNLASAYGIAVTGTFLCTAVLAMVVFRRQFHWSRAAAVSVFGGLFLVDIVFFCRQYGEGRRGRLGAAGARAWR